MTTVLFAVSAADAWTLNDGSTRPTGFWAEELIVPYDIFFDAGFDIDVATPGARQPVVDKLSLSLRGGVFPPTVKKMKKRLRELDGVLAQPKDLHAVDASDYDLIFFPGGHGPMEDLAYDEAVGTLVKQRIASGKMLAMLCHAPAALLAAATETDPTPFAGLKVTGLSNPEERFIPDSSKAKWFLQDKLEKHGLEYSAGFPFRPHVVRDGNVVTGQNPQSSQKLAKTLLEVL